MRSIASWTSRIDSVRDLPVSRLTTAASSRWRSAIPSATARSSAQRCAHGVRRHAPAATRAASTARATISGGAANARLATASSVHGSTRSNASPPATWPPEMACGSGSPPPAARADASRVLELRVGLGAEFAARIRQARAHRPTVSCPASWPSAPTSPAPSGASTTRGSRWPTARGWPRASGCPRTPSRTRCPPSSSTCPTARATPSRAATPTTTPTSPATATRACGSTCAARATPTGSSRTSTCPRSRRTRSTSSRGWRSSRGAAARSACSASRGAASTACRSPRAARRR